MGNRLDRKYVKPSMWNNQVTYIGMAIGFSLSRIILYSEWSYLVMIVFLVMIYFLRYLYREVA